MAHTEPRMKKISLLKLDDLYKQQCLLQVHDCLSKTAPIVVEGLIKTEENSERYELRNSDSNSLKLKVPIFRSRAGGQSFSVQGPSIWNNLPKELYVNRKSVFKNSLKRYFLYHYDSKTACSNPRCNDRSHHT